MLFGRGRVGLPIQGDVRHRRLPSARLRIAVHELVHQLGNGVRHRKAEAAGTPLRIDGIERRMCRFHGDLVRREREESAAAHGVVGNEDRDLPLVLAVKEAATPIQNDART